MGYPILMLVVKSTVGFFAKQTSQKADKIRVIVDTWYMVIVLNTQVIHHRAPFQQAFRIIRQKAEGKVNQALVPLV
jgi:hypothetical protein